MPNSPNQPASSTSSFRSHIFGFLVRYALGRNVDLRERFAPQLATSAEAPLVSTGDLHLLGDLLVEQSGDVWFGVAAAEQAPRGLFDVTEYVGRSAATLRGAIEELVAYGSLINPHVTFELEGATGLFSQRLYDEPVFLGRVINEFVLVHQRKFACEATGRNVHPARVLLAHPKPDLALGPLEHALGTRMLSFDQHRVGLQFSAEDLEAPLLSADPTLSRILQSNVGERLPQRNELGSIRTCMMVLLERGRAPSTKGVAALLRWSERTLQRRLATHGTSFRAILDETRATHACRLLRDPTVKTATVAEQLGYADVASFTRAFRRWHGTTPASFRAARRS